MTIDVTKLISAQEIFAVVAEHILTMPHRATDLGGRCAYRGRDGLSCAIGCLLTDDEYRLGNGETIDDLPDNSVGCLEDQKFLPQRLARHIELLSSLQGVHDNRGNWHGIQEPDAGDGPPRKRKMAVALRRVAEIHALNEDIVDRFL